MRHEEKLISKQSLFEASNHLKQQQNREISMANLTSKIVEMAHKEKVEDILTFTENSLRNEMKPYAKSIVADVFRDKGWYKLRDSVYSL